MSLWASVPHYVAAAPNPKVALALVRAFEGCAWPWTARELEQSAEDYERQVNAAVASDPEVKAFVERLEKALDEVTRGPARRAHFPLPTRSPATSSASCASAGLEGLDKGPSSRRPPGRAPSLHGAWCIDIPGRQLATI